MKVIDLLNKIANGKANYITTDFMFGREKYNLLRFLDTYALDIISLNWEVEIIEEEKKIPEKLDVDEEENGKYIIWNTEYEQCSPLEMKIIKRQDYIINKIKEIIDYLNKENK